MMLLVVDIDGTIANGERRFKLAGPEPDRSDREAYTKWVEAVNTGIDSDEPVAGMANLLRGVCSSSLLYLTSREDKLLHQTADWLDKNNFPYGVLEMRPLGSWEATAHFKESVIKRYLEKAEMGYNAVIVIDDDEHGLIEDMCKKNGWTFLKARSGGQR